MDKRKIQTDARKDKEIDDRAPDLTLKGWRGQT